VSAGFVYLLRADNGLHKIGRSGCPDERMKAFGTLPVAVELIHQIRTDDMEWLEDELHNLYAPSRVRGEWFRLTEEEVLALKARGCTENSPTATAGAETAEVDDLGTIFAANVRRLRAQAGMSQQALAQEANLSLSIVAQVERGRVKDPRYSTLRAIAGVFGVKVKDLTGEG
jgi:DNA-binding XRE family transcriptional regulator